MSLFLDDDDTGANGIPIVAGLDASPLGPARRGASGATWVVISFVVLAVAGVAYLLKREDDSKYAEPVPPPRYEARPELPLTGIPEVDDELRRSHIELGDREAVLRRAQAEVRRAEQASRDAELRLEVERRLKEAIDKNKAAVDAAAMSGTSAPK